jgi:DNA polymerase III alpha subunit
MLTQLKIRSEYSFRAVYGPIEQVVAHLQSQGCKCAALTDRSSTFGHIQWNQHCNTAAIKPIFGVELAFVSDIADKPKRPQFYWLALLARSDAGLREIYSAVEEATANAHYVPRLPISKLESLSADVLILSGNSGIGQYNAQLPSKVIIEAHPATNPVLLNRPAIPVSDNFMIRPENRYIYEVLLGRNAFNRPSAMHIMDRFQLMHDCRYLTNANFALADQLAEECNATLAQATNIKSFEQRSLLELCTIGATIRGIKLEGIYLERMQHELTLIEHKGFADYFKVIADMVQYAKQQMLVGPARGSSCGSLVCYLLGITDIDPIPHHLIFERFIDVTRSDLPDIDIDFQDNKRDLVFRYLIDKYGADKVARLGTVTRYKGRSAIAETAKVVRIPRWDAEQIANSIIKRAEGDYRADNCVADTFSDTEIGQAFIKKFPAIKVAERLEAHARHHSTHAAGVVITNDPINHYVARDVRNNTVHVDKYDAEHINLMKVDCLGLRTLTIIADCLQQIGWNHSTLLAHQLDDAAAFKVLRDKLYCGVFQFEGQALQGLTRKVAVDRFTDLAALTALARPGPLISGAAYEWCARRMQQKPVELLHDMLADITRDTYGLIVFQEQMLRILRDIGLMNWEDVTLFRRGINKKLGMEYFDAQFWDKFKTGALANNIDELTARSIWETVNSAGDYAFNLSHSVAYATVSYWCMVLKAHYPLQFALATLKHVQDALSIKQYLRELDRIGIEFVPYDPQLSEYSWSVKDNKLIGGLTNIKGVGDVLAKAILQRREQNIGFTERQCKLLAEGTTPYDNVFEARRRFADLYIDPKKYGIYNKLWNIADIDDIEGSYTILGRVISWKIRSLNETQFLIERGNMRVADDKWLTLMLEDDTDVIAATVPRKYYARLGEPLTKQNANDWFLLRGAMSNGKRRLYIEKWKQL